jgi:Fe-S-cluster-containing dehydrogenase component
MARAGRLPYCAQSCPNDAIYYGDFEEDLATNGEEVVELSLFLTENQAYRLKEELNTKPRVYYIPGYGQGVGRDPHTEGRLDTEWPWEETIKGAKKWKRSGR